MPWKCGKPNHKDVSIDGSASDKVKPDCPKCGNNTFIKWDGGAPVAKKNLGVLMKTAAGFKVYVESHQGKHTQGKWPGFQGTVEGCQFPSTLVTAGKTDYLLTIWNKIEATVTASADRLGYCYLDCGKKKVGTKDESYVTVQWVKEGSDYYFHAYPEPKKLPGKQYGVM